MKIYCSECEKVVDETEQMKGECFDCYLEKIGEDEKDAL
jgi:hypothetical protein